VKLSYNGLALQDLGTLVIAGGPDAEYAEGQRKRVSLAVRLHTFQQTFAANRGLHDLLLAACRTQNATLLWTEDDGTVRLNRTARVASHSFPEDANAWGTYRQQVDLRFEWWEHDLVPNTLEATFTPGGGAPVTLGNVLTVQRDYSASRASVLRAPRSTATVRLRLTGAFLADTAATLADRRTALAAAQQAMEAAVDNASGELVFGAWTEAGVRVDEFSCAINQPVDAIEWSLSATATRLPLDDAAALTFDVAARTAATGVTQRTVTGTVTCATRALADARLATLFDALMGASDFRLDTDLTERHVQADADGSALVEVAFSQTWQAANPRACSLTAPGESSLDLGTVTQWSEVVENERAHAQRDPRLQSNVRLTAAGRLVPPGGLDEAARRSWLEGRRDALRVAAAAPSATLVHGTFNAALRIESATMELDAAADSAPWSLSAVYSLFPAEGAVSATYTVAEREEDPGIVMAAFSGALLGATREACEAKLTALRAAVFDGAAWFQRSSEFTPSSVSSPDGTVLIECTFADQWQKKNARTATVQRDGYSAVELGEVEKWAENYGAARTSFLRSERTQALGRVSVSGTLPSAAGLSAAQARDFFDARHAALLQAVDTKETTLAYGAFDRLVRVEDFTWNVDQSRRIAAWTLTCGYTRFPDEADYALAEFTVRDQRDQASGALTRSISGRIGAPNRAGADAKLVLLRAAYTPAAAWAVATREATEQWVHADADGEAWIELNFSEEYRSITADIVDWSLSVSDTTDAASGQLTTTYSGQVTARGADFALAQAAAIARARVLGDGKHQFKMREQLTPEDHQDLAGLGERQCRVSFSFEYRRRVARLYGEAGMDRSSAVADASVETVSGYFVGETEAAAQVPLTALRAVYAASLVRDERRSVSVVHIGAESGIADGPGESDAIGLKRQFTRIEFSFRVHVARGASETSLRYSLESEVDYVDLRRVSSVRGIAQASTRAAAEAAVGTLLTQLDLGAVKMLSYGEEVEVAAFGTGGQRSGFLGLNFAATIETRLTGTDALRQCEVREELEHSGTRWVARPTAGSRDVMQSCGIQSGRRTVSGSVRAATEALCDAWITAQRSLLDGTYETPPQIGTAFVFDPLVVGVARGGSANARLIEKTFRFQEFLPDEDYA